MLGQIVDEEGAGIPDLTVQAKSGGIYTAGQVWTTKTRKDGRFKMQGLPASQKMTWSLDKTRVKTTSFKARIEIDTSELTSDTTLKIEPIVCCDFSMLLGELPELDVKGLSNDESVKVLKAYIKDCFARIPKVPRKYTRQGGSDDPLHLYVEKVIAKTQPVIWEIIERNPGIEFELKLLADMGRLITRNRHTDGMFGRSGNQFNALVFKRLLEKHVDKKEAQEPLVVAIMSSLGEREKRWQRLFDASPFPETKALAATQLAVSAIHKIGSTCEADHSQSSFEKIFAEYDKQLSYVEEHAKELGPKWGTFSKTHFLEQLKYLERRLKPSEKNAPTSGALQPPKLDQARTKKVLKRLETVTQALKDSSRKN